MSHERIRAYINESRQFTTRALAALVLDRPGSTGMTPAAEDQAWVALADAHKHLTTALAFVNADERQQQAAK